MSYSEWWIFAGIGGLFIILGIIAIVWGNKEESDYYTNISGRVDVREYVNRSPFRPEPGALKIGGIICLAIGIVLLGIGIWFWLQIR